jgi:hypothetical protein
MQEGLSMSAPTCLTIAFSGYGARTFSQARASAGDLPPPVPLYERTQTAYGFGAANHIEAADQRGIVLPAGASALPAVTDDWTQGFFFTVDEMLQYIAASYVIAGKGATAHSQNGAGGMGFILRSTVDGTSIYVSVGALNTALRTWWPAANPQIAVERGASYLTVFGQKGNTPFFSLVRVAGDGRIAPVLVSSLVGGANNGTNSWKYGANGTTPQYTSGTYDFFDSFGCATAVADGGNRRGAGGSVGGFFNLWGSFPFVGGVPDPDLLFAIAAGRHDGVTLAAAIGGTLRYANHLRGPGDLAADARGAVTAAATESGMNARVAPFAAAPLRQTPELTLDTYGDGFVFAMEGTGRQGSVPFSGSFIGRAGAGSFEARLVRVDTGADLVGWTQLVATIAGQRFSASLPGIAGGVAFRREIRWKNRPAITVRDGDRHGVGLVVYDIGQSQLAYQGYATNTPDGGGGANLAPSNTTNKWLAVLKQPFFLNGQGLGGGPLGNVALFRPYVAGQHGDGNIRTWEAISRLLDAPLMLVDSAVPGSHPNQHTLDRSVQSYSVLFTPDGTTTVFSFTPVASGLRIEGMASTTAATPVPGSVSIVCGGVTITDDPVTGNLQGIGISAGTINYATGAVSNLTFAVAPAAGVVPSGTFKWFATAPEQAQAINAGRWSIFGDAGLPLDRTNKTGRHMMHLARLRGTAISMFRGYWFTGFENVAGAAAFATILDRLKTRFDAVYPAGADALWGWGMPGRSASGSGAETSGTYRTFSMLFRAWTAGRSYTRSLGSYLDIEISNNSGPHQSPVLGGATTLGERLGVGIAAAFATGLSVDGPILASAAFVDGTRTSIDCVFTLPNGTALATADGSTMGIRGFRIAPAGTAQNAWDWSGFTAAITGPARVRLTKASGSWTAGQRIAYGNGVPVQENASNPTGETADNLLLKKMLCDNDGSFAGQTKYLASGRPGNLASMADGIVIDG